MLEAPNRLLVCYSRNPYQFCLTLVNKKELNNFITLNFKNNHYLINQYCITIPKFFHFLILSRLFVCKRSLRKERAHLVYIRINMSIRNMLKLFIFWKLGDIKQSKIFLLVHSEQDGIFTGKFFI